MKKKAFLVAIILLILWIISVFWFSSQNLHNSDQTSGKVAKVLITISNKFFRTSYKYDISNTFQYFVRKTAHFTLYLIGGFILMSVFLTLKFTLNQKILLSTLLITMFAILDEFHQIFSSNRTPKLTDVYIDTLGAITGILIALLVFLIYYRGKDKSKFLKGESYGNS